MIISLRASHLIFPPVKEREDLDSALLDYNDC